MLKGNSHNFQVRVRFKSLAHKALSKGSTFLHGSCSAGAVLKERGMSRWVRLMTQLVHTQRACVHIPCFGCVLVNSFEPEYGLDERVDKAVDSDEDGGG